ncbi:MAG: hypothetical protein K6E36_12695 [Oscillospiraceae bacterium]|nr:hypothetical protein [Oscillospiraceae bacterium]
MKQNEWFEATSRIAEQYITEARPKRLQSAGNQGADFRPAEEELPDVRSRQHRIAHWVTTGFATAAALAVVIGGGVLISKFRNKVPTKPGNSEVTTAVTAATDTTEISGDFQQGHEAGAAAAREAVAAGRDRIIFSGTVTDQVAGIYDDALDSDMKYVALGRAAAYDYARVIHVSRTLADSLEVGKFYRFTIDERITETDPSALKENKGVPALSFLSAAEVESGTDYEDDITFSRAETNGNTAADYVRGYQEGYRDVLLNLDVDHNYYRLGGSLTAYIRGVLNPDLGSSSEAEANDFARCLVVAESPDHKSVFPIYYPYKKRAELVQGQLVTFLLTQNEDNAIYQAQYLSSRLSSHVNPAEIEVIFDSLRAPQDGEEANWNRLTAAKQYGDDATGTTDSGNKTETTTTAQADETKVWQQGEKPYGFYSGWIFYRDGDELQLEDFVYDNRHAMTAMLNGGGTAVTQLADTKPNDAIYNGTYPVSDGEKAYILKDGQIVSTDGSRVLMTGIRTSAGQHYSLSKVEKVNNSCWLVTMNESWENGGGWQNEYWCDGNGKTVEISADTTPSYTVLLAEDGSCVYYLDENGIYRAGLFEDTAVNIVSGDAIRAARTDQMETYTDWQAAFLKNGTIYIPVTYNGDGSPSGDVITVEPEGSKTPTEKHFKLDWTFKAGGRIYGVTQDGTKLAEYLPETGETRTVADIRSAYAAAAKDSANIALQAELAELGREGRIICVDGIWDDLVIVSVAANTYRTHAAVSLANGAVQILWETKG